MENSTEAPKPIVHYLKTHSTYFRMIKGRVKRYELRKDDRGAESGHFLCLMDFNPESGNYTGQQQIVLINGKLKDVPKFGLKPGYAIFDLKFYEEMNDAQKDDVQTILNGMM